MLQLSTIIPKNISFQDMQMYIWLQIIIFFIVLVFSSIKHIILKLCPLCAHNSSLEVLNYKINVYFYCKMYSHQLSQNYISLINTFTNIFFFINIFYCKCSMWVYVHRLQRLLNWWIKNALVRLFFPVFTINKSTFSSI